MPRIEIYIHPVLKLALIGMLGFLVAFGGIVFESEMALLLGTIAAGAALMGIWLFYAAIGGDGSSCEGRVNWFGNEELEIYIGTCDSCDRWMIRVRDRVMANGKGFDAFSEAAEQVAKQYEGHVPAIASELRELVSKLGDDGEISAKRET